MRDYDFILTCPACERLIGVAARDLGARGRCPRCGNALTIPAMPPTHDAEDYPELMARTVVQPDPLPDAYTKSSLEAWAEAQIAGGVPRGLLVRFLLETYQQTVLEVGTERKLLLQVMRDVSAVFGTRQRQAKELERAGRPDEAARLYEANVEDYFCGAQPYERLRLYYMRRQDYASALRICEAHVRIHDALEPDGVHGDDTVRSMFLRHAKRLRKRMSRMGRGPS